LYDDFVRFFDVHNPSPRVSALDEEKELRVLADKDPVLHGVELSTIDDLRANVMSRFWDARFVRVETLKKSRVENFMQYWHKRLEE
jgi:hypothetical protein